jgi:hypothetical protein
MSAEVVVHPAAGPDRSLMARMCLVVGCLMMVDILSHLLLAFADWTPETPLRRLAALQTSGTQTTVLVLALILIGAGLLIMDWPAARRRVVVWALALLGVAAVWLAMRSPGLVGDPLANVSVSDPERLQRGSRQAMAGWFGLGAWALGVAALLMRRSNAPPRIN